MFFEIAMIAFSWFSVTQGTLIVLDGKRELYPEDVFEAMLWPLHIFQPITNLFLPEISEAL